MQDQAQEVGTGQRAYLHFTTLAVAVAKAGLAVFTGQNAGFPEYPR